MRRIIVIALLLISVSCKSRQSKIEKARDELSSWTATGELLSKEWSAGAAQTQYVKSTAEVAADEVKKLGQTLQNDKSVGKACSLYQQLSDAVDRDDRATGKELAAAFKALGDQRPKS